MLHACPFTAVPLRSPCAVLGHSVVALGGDSDQCLLQSLLLRHLCADQYSDQGDVTSFELMRGHSCGHSVEWGSPPGTNSAADTLSTWPPSCGLALAL